MLTSFADVMQVNSARMTTKNGAVFIASVVLRLGEFVSVFIGVVEDLSDALGGGVLLKAESHAEVETANRPT